MTKQVEKVLEDEAVVSTEADAPSDDLVVYILNKPIKSYGETIRTIKMRRPSGNDLLVVGNPVIYYPHEEPVKIEHDLPKVVRMVSRISEPPIPTSSLALMEPSDMLGLAWTISPFFIPAR